MAFMTTSHFAGGGMPPGVVNWTMQAGYPFNTGRTRCDRCHNRSGVAALRTRGAGRNGSASSYAGEPLKAARVDPRIHRIASRMLGWMAGSTLAIAVAIARPVMTAHQIKRNALERDD